MGCSTFRKVHMYSGLMQVVQVEYKLQAKCLNSLQSSFETNLSNLVVSLKWLTFVLRQEMLTR
jgi:hypothetical protein